MIDNKRGKAESVPGEILVRFKEAAASKVARSQMTITESGRQIPMQIEQLNGPEIVEGLRLARVASGDTAAAIKALNARSDVLYAEPNFIRHKEAVPNDPRYGEQWALKNTGQAGGFAGADIKAEPAWDITTGSRTIVVGVVDEGIDINHIDLKDNIWNNPGEIPNNGVDDDSNGYVDDVNGWDFLHNDKTVFDGNGTYPADETDAHGTHVAGTIGATGNNGTGVVGVNWQVSLMSLKFLGPSGGTTANLLQALSYAKTMRDLWISSGGAKGANIRVLNNSYGGPGFSQAELDAIHALNDANILFVAAAGNDHQDNDRFPTYPANYNSPNVISVAASNSGDGYAYPTNLGYRTVHLFAPGTAILSTTPNNTYDFFDGTSMASPHVAGAAALVCAKDPNVTMSRLSAALVFGGDENSNFAATISGRRLSANGSLQNIAENDSTAPADISDFHLTSQSGRSITVQWTAPGDDGAVGRAAAYELRFSDADIGVSTQFDQARLLIPPHPISAGGVQTATVQIPYQHLTGFVGIRAVDNVGNHSGIAKIPVSVSQDIADPYLVSESAASPLSTGGTALGLKGDDRHSDAYTLPFVFQHYNQAYTSLFVSTNGVLYFSTPPTLPYNQQYPFENSADSNSSIALLNAYSMIAGLWDDLRTDTRTTDDVYVVTPDPDRIIFRWQAVTFNGANPVSFEIELRRDGTILNRYGVGNQQVRPVVGVSNSQPDAYVVQSHTSESVAIDLTSAPTVTFALRNPPPPPSADLTVSMSTNPNPAVSGLNMTYSVVVHNNGPNPAPNVTLTDQLPAGTTFVSCTAGQGTCSGLPVGSTGTVTANIGNLGDYSFSTVPVDIVVKVTAAPATNLINTATVASPLRDNNTANNSFTRITGVVADVAFSGVRAIASGAYFSVAVRTDGTVWAWGQFGGVLGDGTTNGSNTPVQVSGLTNAVGVAAGGYFAFTNMADGTVWAWGKNNYGQLGDGTTVDRLTPVKVNGLTGVIAVTAAGGNGVALKSDGTVWTWGWGYLLGNNTTVNSPTPVQVNGLTNVSAISGRGPIFALKTDGTLWSWGFNQFGALGDGTTVDRLAPVQVTGLTNVIGIGAGSDHCLAIRNDGSVWAWGLNRYYQIGQPQPNQDFTPHPTPLQVSGISGAIAVAGGAQHSMVLRNDGAVWTFGDNNGLQLGHPANCCTPVPGAVDGLSGVQAVAAGERHSLALLTDGSLRAWGDNFYGQLGDGTTTTRGAPVRVSGLSTVSQPTFSPDQGDYTSAQDVTISCATSGSVLRYTINGNDPTESDPVIASGSSIHVNAGMITVLKVRAWKDGWLPSAVKTANYSIFIPPNPIDDPSTFVRRHYLDFLNREPDQGGWDFWTNKITQCGSDALCIRNRRIEVSAAFFIELEFQETGYVVYRMYRAAFGAMPGAPTRANVLSPQFNADRALLVGGAGLPQSTIDLANAFVLRSAFRDEYPDAWSNAQFVNHLFDMANLTGAANATLRQAEIDAMTNNSRTRGQVLLRVIEIPEFKNREYKPAFVLMQYFGYLRRDPDQGGYDFWLNILNNNLPNDSSGYRAMVCAFITSGEYQLRFGSQITHTNQECQ